MIPLAEPNLTGNESGYLQECLTTNFVSSVGAFVNRFEDEFARFVAAPHAVATANGTSAIHIALLIAGVEPGDEVWVSDFTFIASSNPILYVQAVPVLVDSERRSWNMDPGLVVEELDRRARQGRKLPKAIILVHILGLPANLEPIAEACDRHGVTLIEDAAEALGASYTEGALRGRQVGTLSRLGCFSFNGNKIITTGGGGMVVTEDATLARRAKHLTTQAKMPGLAYMHDEVGYNYRLTNLQAALGVAQLERLSAFIAKKREIAARYDSALAGIPGLACPPRPAGTAPSCWLYSVLLDPGWQEPQAFLEAKGIQSRPLWTPLHLMEPYRGFQLIGSGQEAERLARMGLSLPCSTSLTAEQQETVIAAVGDMARQLPGFGAGHGA
jgi:dTDP-4-amino-4,6-dideoxygalactose transaminase